MVIFLVLVGGIVRSTGAGLGCPDWPRCFGLWVPPTDISQIPAAYYSNPLATKDGKLVFNVVKTWTEYLNRMLGVVIGFSIFIQMVYAFLAKASGFSRWMSIAAFLMVAFQGWLGAKVVSSDLRPLVITIHLVVALFIALALLAALYYASYASAGRNGNKIQNKSVAIWILVLIGVQFFLGTEVRGQVDVLFKVYDYAQRHLYAPLLDGNFLIHRSLSLLVLGLLVYQVFVFGKKLDVQKFQLLLWPLGCAIALIMSGVVLNYLRFPAFVQPFHLLFGFLIFCAQFWLLIHLYSTKEMTYAAG